MTEATPKTPRMMGWSLSPRPRSPEQFLSMMRVLVNFNGVKWWRKDKRGQPANQIAFLDALMDSPEFSLMPKSESVMQGRTYVTMNPPALGFAHISDDENAEDKTLVVTQAGYHAAEARNLQVLFTKQLLKWQYPSYVHGGPGGKGSGHFPLRDKWSIHPFLATMDVCRRVGGLSKHEIAVYLLTMVGDDDASSVAAEIEKCRDKLSLVDGARQKSEVRDKILESKMREVYKEEIADGRYRKRQANSAMPKSEMISEMIMAKMRNNMDYTDTVMRYFRFTGLFRESDRWQNLTIDAHQEWKVDEILLNKSKYSKLNNDYGNCKKFYDYFGNPFEPRLPWETDEGMGRAILENILNSMEILGLDVTGLDSRAPNTETINERIAELNNELAMRKLELTEPVGRLRSEDFAELSRASEQTQVNLKEVGRVIAADSFKDDKGFDTTVEMFTNVNENKKWNAPYMEVPLLFEWAMYRSIYGLGGHVLEELSPKLNYDGTEPIFTASGKQCDVVGEFAKAYLALEATVTSGVRQYDTEAEPVTRHVARFMEDHPDKKPTLCFFVARKLDDNTKEFFSIYNVYHRHPSTHTHLNIIPLEIDEYVKVIKTLRTKKSYDGVLFARIVDALEKIRLDRRCNKCSRPDLSSEEWYKKVRDVIDGLLK